MLLLYKKNTNLTFIKCDKKVAKNYIPEKQVIVIV